MTSNTELHANWRAARLIPTVGIRGQEEQERRATSSLLAVIGAVPDFGRALIGPLGAPKGTISTFAEVNLKGPDGKRSTPDGAIIVERGKTRWTALVEVKTGSADLTDEQVTRYVELARDHSLDAVLTISNQITARPEDSPVRVDKRKLTKVALRHLSWWRVLTEAIVLHRHSLVSDPEQSWILGELIAYLDDEASGASGFTDMGESWITVRDAARAGTLRERDPEVHKVAERWEQFLQYLCLGLSQDLGRDVRIVGGRKDTSDSRVEAQVKRLASDGALTGAVKVPDAVGPLEVRAELGARQVRTSVTLEAPKDGRPLTRVNWLLRQLKDAPADLRIDTAFAGARETSSELLGKARESPHVLLSQTDAKREPRAFTITLSRSMGLKRGKTQGSFVAETRRQAFDFYRDLIQDLRAWQASAPKLPEPSEQPAPSPDPAPTPPSSSSPDQRDPGEVRSPDLAARQAPGTAPWSAPR